MPHLKLTKQIIQEIMHLPSISKKLRSTFIKAAISGTVLALIFHFIPLSHVLGAVRTAHLEWVVMGILLSILLKVLTAFKMQMIANTQGLNTNSLMMMRILFTSTFYSLLAPGALAGGAVTYLKYRQQGVEPIAVDIPGVAGARLRSTGMNVDSGVVRVELLGLGGGIGRTATMNKGETLAYENLRITFDDFDMSDFDPEAGKINFGVVFSVAMDGQQIEVVPTYQGGRTGEPVITPAMVPGSGGITLSPGRIDAENGTVQVQVYDPSIAAVGPEPASLVIDVSTKPLIALVWLGTLLVMAGILVAIARRGKDVASVPLES